MRVLITGAAGTVGSIIGPKLAEEHDVLLTDLPEKGLEPLDVTDADSVRDKVGWCDVVVHCAIGGGMANEWYPQVFEQCVERARVDCGGTLRVLWAAAELGKRAVYISSCNALEYHSLGQYVTESTPARGASVYGLTKVFGEKCARELHADLGLQVVVARLGGCGKTFNDLKAVAEECGSARPRHWMTDRRDVAEGISCIVNAPKPWSLVHLVGDVPGRRWELETGWLDFRFRPRYGCDARGCLRQDDRGELTEEDAALVDAAILDTVTGQEQADHCSGNGLALRWACSLGNTKSAERLLDMGADPNSHGGDPLRQAASSGSIPTMELLLSRGADPNGDGGEAVSWAAARCQDDAALHVVNLGCCTVEQLSLAAYHAILADRPSLLDALLEAGSDPNYGHGILMDFAVLQDGYGPRRGNADMVCALKRSGYRWQCCYDSNNGTMPLDRVIETTGNTAVVQALLDCGADPRCITRYSIRCALENGFDEALRLVGIDETGKELPDGAGSPIDLWLRYLESCK